MSREIRPLEPGDLAELGRFLTAGFHADADADFGAPEVLRWKYLGGEAGGPPPEPPLSHIALDESGRIIGHLGLCRTAFEGRALAAAGGRVETIHIIDWLGSPGARSVGMSLMRRAHQGVPTQFGLGVSPSALVVGERAGYDLRSLVPVYSRVLRPGYWLRAGGLNLGNAAPFDNERARVHKGQVITSGAGHFHCPVTGGLAHRNRLSGEEGFIHREVHARKKHRICGHPVSFRENDEVFPHHFPAGDPLLPAVSDHKGPGTG